MRFLIVEDEIDVADLIQMFISLEFPEAEVAIADSGVTALEQIAKQGSFDIVFSDFNMPNMNGGSLYLELRKLHPTVPFVLVSSEEPNKHKQFIGATYFHHIDKPFSDKDITNLIIKLQAGVKETASVRNEYVPLHLDSLSRMGKSSTPLYLKISKDKFVKVFHENVNISEAEIQKIRDKKVNEVFIERIHFENFIRDFRKNIFSRLAWESTQAMEKFNIISDDLAMISKASKVFGWSPAVMSLAQENINSVINIIKKEPKCLRIVDMLKAKDGRGFSQHSVLLTILLTDLAQRMGWVSQGTIEKLTFAALLHDIELDDTMFADKQTLLMNNDMESLKETPEGNKIWSHPVDAAELTLNWPSCPTDVDIIIRQHHERPDGKGFPLGLPALKISPLSAAFIICEDLVYMSINYPSRNLKDLFLEKKDYYNREPFKVLFSKVLEIFFDIILENLDRVLF